MGWLRHRGYALGLVTPPGSSAPLNVSSPPSSRNVPLTANEEIFLSNTTNQEMGWGEWEEGDDR
jgi:hypothetical protein